ncbi:MAG: hypothetical protein A4E55_00760 [Pelotomaculum sp. PtaU1.Bin035]|nr:MAG: hypothetical protein A4E55_00760 [Pelotomaculum sp. PtaU1.Bin035]
MTEYSVFLDESGIESYKNTDSHYVVAGLILEKDYFVNEAMASIRALKTKHFNSDKVVFHFFDMVRRKGSFKIFNDRIKRRDFWDDYIQLISKLNFKVVGAVVKKNDMTNRYLYPQAPKRVALPVIYENLVHFLASNDATGKIFVEQFNETEDERVSVQYHLSMANGTSRISREAFLRHIKGLKFLPKNQNILGLQLADLVAYLTNVKARGGVFSANKEPNLGDIWNIIWDKTYDGNCKNKNMYGIKFLP